MKNLLARQLMKRTSEAIEAAMMTKRDFGDVGGSSSRHKNKLNNPYQKLTTQLMMFPSALAPRPFASSDQQKVEEAPSPSPQHGARKSRTLLQDKIVEEEEKEESSLVSDSSDLEKSSGLNLNKSKSYAVPKITITPSQDVLPMQKNNLSNGVKAVNLKPLSIFKSPDSKQGNID